MCKQQIRFLLKEQNLLQTACVCSASKVYRAPGPFTLFLLPMTFFLNSSLGTFSNSQEITPSNTIYLKNQIRSKKIKLGERYPHHSIYHLVLLPTCQWNIPSVCAKRHALSLINSIYWGMQIPECVSTVLKKINLKSWFVSASTHKISCIFKEHLIKTHQFNEYLYTIFAFKLQHPKRATVLFQIRKPFAKAVLYWVKRIMQNQ